MKSDFVLIGAVSTLLLGLPATAQPRADGACFWTRDLRNHTVGDSHTLYFNLAGRAVYRVETSDSCLAGMSATDPIVLHDRASSGQVCDKTNLDISARGARCIVASMTRLTPAEAAALPRRIRP